MPPRDCLSLTAFVAMALTLGTVLPANASVPLRACTPEPGYTQCQVFDYTGGDQAFTVPEGVSSIAVRMWGAGGGTGGEYETGGSGGYAAASIAATPGERFLVMVGGGGHKANAPDEPYDRAYGGGGIGGMAYKSDAIGDITPFRIAPGGGGMSALWTNTDALDPLLTAGGGGGALPGFYDYDEVGSVAGGGGGGGAEGAASSLSLSGAGGTQTGGGAAGADPAQCIGQATPGAAFLGGHGGDSQPQNYKATSLSGGGGGGGYFGGGGGVGVCRGSEGSSPGGGGGGSGFAATERATDVDLVVGSYGTLGGARPPHTDDPHYVRGVGAGGARPNGAGGGGNGRVVLQWADTLPDVPLPTDVSADGAVITGKGIPGARVDVRTDEDELLSSVDGGPDGSWTATAASAETGTIRALVTQTMDQRTSKAVEIDVDLGGPLVVTSPATGETVHTAKPEFHGSGAPSSDIVVAGATGKELARAKVLDDGSWTATSTIGLPTGAYTLFITQTTPGGSPSSVARSFNIISMAPLTVTWPKQFSSVDIPFGERLIVKGLGTPEAAVRLTGEGIDADSTLVQSDGTWGIQVKSFPNALTTILVTQTPADGDPESTMSLTVTLQLVVSPPTVDIDLMTIPATFSGTATPYSDITVRDSGRIVGHSITAEDGAYSLTLDEDLPGTRLAVQSEISGLASLPTPAHYLADPLSVTTPTTDVVVGPDALFAGRGVPGGTVEVRGTARLIAKATVAEDGSWSARSMIALADGIYQTTVHLDAGQRSSSTPLTFSVGDHFAVSEPSDNSVVRQIRPVFSGTGQDGATVEVVGRGSGRSLGSTRVLDGKWTVQSAYDLPREWLIVDVVHTLGTVESRAPIAFLVMPLGGSAQVISTSPARYESAHPTFTGTGEPGAAISVAGITTRVLAETTVRENGTWEATSRIALTPGTYAVTARQTGVGLPATSAVIDFVLSESIGPR